MRIVFIHYHLQPGGVTKVILNTVKALEQSPSFKLLILCGEAPPSSLEINTPVKVIKGLAYEGKRPQNISAQELKKEILKVSKSVFGTFPDIFHVHNHNLGKNLLLPQVVYGLAQEGFPLFLHIHDFAEDGRPGNYQLLLKHLGENNFENLSTYLYPQGPHLHYLFLTSRDIKFFQYAGGSSNLHHLPNPIQNTFFSAKLEKNIFPRQRLWLYPTRGIRRKNIGELIFWSTQARANDVFATTLGPQNPLQRPYFKLWKNFAQTHNLPLHLELANTYPYEQLLKEAHFCLTTSITEGFGLVFLEPWLNNKALFGRDLPEITRDFKEKEIKLPYLYPSLKISLNKLNQNLLHQKIHTKIKSLFALYSLPLKQDFIDKTISNWTQNKQIDFGKLDEELQMQVLEKIIKHKEKIFNLPENIDYHLIEENKKKIEKNFSLSNYIFKLKNIYLEATNKQSKLEGFADSERLLECFLSPENLSLLKIDEV